MPEIGYEKFRNPEKNPEESHPSIRSIRFSYSEMVNLTHSRFCTHLNFVLPTLYFVTFSRWPWCQLVRSVRPSIAIIWYDMSHRTLYTKTWFGISNWYSYWYLIYLPGHANLRIGESWASILLAGPVALQPHWPYSQSLLPPDLPNNHFTKSRWCMWTRSWNNRYNLFLVYLATVLASGKGKKILPFSCLMLDLHPHIPPLLTPLYDHHCSSSILPHLHWFHIPTAHTPGD